MISSTKQCTSGASSLVVDSIDQLGSTMLSELESATTTTSHTFFNTTAAAAQVECTSSSSSENDTEAEEDKYGEGPYDPANYMLNTLRNGMNTVHSLARKTLAECKTEKSHDETITDMKSYTLGLLRREKVFTESFSICTQIIDDVVAEEEEEEEQNVVSDAGDGCCDAGGNDKKLLRPYFPTVEGLTRTRERMNQMYDERIDALETSLTDDKLKMHPRFVALEQQIELGSEEFKVNLQKQAELDKKWAAAEGDDDALLATLLDACKDRLHIEYGEEVHDGPSSSTEYIDPITKRPIHNPARNLKCRHVFEKQSIQEYIQKNPDSARCPVAGCTNESILKMEDFL